MRAVITETYVLVAGLLVFFGLAASSIPLLALGALILGTGSIARLWARLALEEVVYSRTLTEHRLFVGERVEIQLKIENRKIVPVPWLEVREQLPRGMEVDGNTQASTAPGARTLVRSTSLGSNDRLTWPIALRAVSRGYFRVGPTKLKSGDLFGLYETEEEHGRPVDGIVVYPRTYPLPDLGLDSERPFGDRRGGNPVFEDPSRVVGVRDYQPGDQMRRIDWKSTARAQRLQSRLYEPSRSFSVIVALNIPTFEQTWQGSDPILLERGVSVAASLARAAVEAGYAVGLIANGSFPDADRPIRIGAGSRPDQLNRILEALATVTSFTTSNMSGELEEPREGQALPVGATVVLVAALLGPQLGATLQRLRKQGHHVHVVKTSEKPWEVELGGIPISEIAAVMEPLEAAAVAEGIVTVDDGAWRRAGQGRTPAELPV
jgi:uncharacterized protein (DUF58 family)